MVRWLPLVFVMLLLGCSDDDKVVFDNESDLLGRWLLIEQYADPGDGSGEFRKVESDKVIRFFDDGTYTSNGTLCFMGVESTEEVSGTYEINDMDLSQFSSENFIVPEDCTFEASNVFIHLEGDKLILSYLCIEGCGQKYRKL
jgi:hypothetical protein